MVGQDRTAWRPMARLYPLRAGAARLRQLLGEAAQPAHSHSTTQWPELEPKGPEHSSPRDCPTMLGGQDCFCPASPVAPGRFNPLASPLHPLAPILRHHLPAETRVCVAHPGPMGLDFISQALLGKLDRNSLTRPPSTIRQALGEPCSGPCLSWQVAQAAAAAAAVASAGATQCQVGRAASAHHPLWRLGDRVWPCRPWAGQTPSRRPPCIAGWAGG